MRARAAPRRHDERAQRQAPPIKRLDSSHLYNSTPSSRRRRWLDFEGALQVIVTIDLLEMDRLLMRCAADGASKEVCMNRLLLVLLGLMFMACTAPLTKQEQEDEAFVAQYQKDQAQKKSKLESFSGTSSLEIISSYKENKFAMKQAYMNKDICIKDLKLYSFNELYSALAVYPKMQETKDGLVHYDFVCEGEKTEAELSLYKKDFAQICGKITEVKTSEIYKSTKYLTQFTVNPCTLKQ
jgi:hypothetical protein